MKVVALVSGGKDSCYAMMKCMQYGHQIVALANLLPADDSVDELDSYMYQTVGHQILVGYAKCMGIPLFRRRIQGSTRHQKLGYRVTPGDEVEDMYVLLKEVKKQIPSIEAVSSGAIASDYQRLRVESVCSRLGLVSLAYLWKQDQSLLLQEMIDNGIVAILVKVAAMGLDPAKHLGREISSMSSYLHKLKELYGINVCGEGGEYETLTLDCPLFINARIVLDEFQTVLHSADSIAPVGVLHPVAFHLVNKVDATLKRQENVYGLYDDKMSLVHEIQGEYPPECEDNDESVGASDLTVATDGVFNVSLREKQHIFSFSCWLLERKASSGLQEDLTEVLKLVEKKIAAFGLNWKNVLYIHLYIANMDDFAVVNETYVKFITQYKCPFGVPSRSTVELPLSEVGLGRAYMEVLVANDQSKRVLHVQSISCWAPSCIGPYSQATLQKNILYMAGQLGLDPPTMTLCSGGPVAELEKALENSEAVANCYGCSISTSVISFVIYCSESIPSSERCKIQDKLDAVLKQMGAVQENSHKLLEALFLYVLVPCLPKRSYVEVKPTIYVPDETEMCTEEETETESALSLDYWGFQHESWHDCCMDKCIVDRKVCSLLLSITQEFAIKMFSKYLDADQKIEDTGSLSERQTETLSKFCIYLFDRVLVENSFCWDDILNIRIYLPVQLRIHIQTLLLIFKKAVAELAEMGRRINTTNQTFFSIIPVSGAGKSATSMDDVMTCELLAQRT